MENEAITQKVQDLLSRLGLKTREFARLIGIDHGNLSRLLIGKRKWTLGHLQLVARGAGVDVSELLPNGRKVPIVAEIGADGNFHYDPTTTPLGHAPLPTILARGSLVKKNFYCIKLREECEGFAPGTLLYAQRETSDSIRDRDYIVCPRETGNANVARVMVGDDTITLTQNGKRVATLPKGHLKLCDRIVSVVFPM